MKLKETSKKLSVIVFTSNDPFSAILLMSLHNNKRFEIKKVIFEKERMGKRTNSSILKKVIQTSGYRYALYQVAEVLTYTWMIKILTWVKKSKLLLPKDLCHQYNVGLSDFEL